MNAIGQNITVFFPENDEKKEKAEEKTFPKSALEFNNGWFINLPQSEPVDHDLDNITPIVAKEKELLRESANPENQEKAERQERTQQNPNNRRPAPKDSSNPNNPNAKRNPNWHGNRKNFKKFPPRKEGKENQEQNKE